MKKNSTGVIWGILLILVGIGIGGKILDLFDFDVFFDGWWTLFLIIPSAVRFFTERGERIQALGGLTIGVLLLLAAQDFIEWSMFLPLFMALMFVIIGLRMIVSGGRKSKKHAESYRREAAAQPRSRKNAKGGERYWDNIEDAAEYYFEDEYDYYGDEPVTEQQAEPFEYKQSTMHREPREDFNTHYGSSQYRYQSSREAGNSYRYSEDRGPNRQPNEQSFRSQESHRGGRCGCTAILTGREIRYRHEIFEGASLSTILGAIDLNLSEAVISHDVTIDAVVALGGLEITMPKNVRLVVNCTPVLGGVDNHIKRQPPLPPDAVTVYLNASCILGGIDIK